jgi:hypothetical protein
VGRPACLSRGTGSVGWDEITSDSTGTYGGCPDHGVLSCEGPPPAADALSGLGGKLYSLRSLAISQCACRPTL